MQKQRKETIKKWNDLQVVKELEELQIRDAFKKTSDGGKCPNQGEGGLQKL